MGAHDVAVGGEVPLAHGIETLLYGGLESRRDDKRPAHVCPMPSMSGSRKAAALLRRLWGGYFAALGPHQLRQLAGLLQQTFRILQAALGRGPLEQGIQQQADVGPGR